MSLVVCYPVSAYALFPGDLGKIDVEAQKRKMKPRSSLCFNFLSICFILSSTNFVAFPFVVCYPVSPNSLYPGDPGKIDVGVGSTKKKNEATCNLACVSLVYNSSWYLLVQISWHFSLLYVSPNALFPGVSPNALFPGDPGKIDVMA